MDISEAQINQAKSKPHPSNIDFRFLMMNSHLLSISFHTILLTRQGPAERIPLEDGSVQLVNVSQAAHYFSLSAFFQEVERILCLNGIVAISAYVNFNFDGHQEDEAKAMSAAFEQVNWNMLKSHHLTLSTIQTFSFTWKNSLRIQLLSSGWSSVNTATSSCLSKNPSGKKWKQLLRNSRLCPNSIWV